MPRFHRMRWPRPRLENDGENDLVKSCAIESSKDSSEDSPQDSPEPAVPYHSRVSLFLMTDSFETGGSERQFVLLARNLPSERFQLHAGCLSHQGPFADGFADVPEFRMGGSLYGWTSLGTRWRLSRHLRHNQVQIAHAFDFYTNLTLIPAARLARVPVVIGSHRQLGDLMTPAQFRIQAEAFRWCDAVVCNSHAGANRLAAAGVSRRKLFVIGNALAAEAFVAMPAALPRRPGVLRVGMVARMNARYKGHSGFLRIAARIHRQLPDVEFLLAGDGPLRRELEQEAQTLGLGAHVAFLGDRRDIPAVLASMDVAVLTSDSEGLSNVILEAMAAGLPVVAYDVGGNAELVNEQRGALVAAGDEAAFAAAVERILADCSSSSLSRQQMGRNARGFAEENFGLERVRNRYLEVYETLLQRKRPRTNTPNAPTADAPTTSGA
jgi:glycosyltransferase involved in cell wall biosynthesis